MPSPCHHIYDSGGPVFYDNTALGLPSAVTGANKLQSAYITTNGVTSAALPVRKTQTRQ